MNVFGNGVIVDSMPIYEGVFQHRDASDKARFGQMDRKRRISY